MHDLCCSTWAAAMPTLMAAEGLAILVKTMDAVQRFDDLIVWS